MKASHVVTARPGEDIFTVLRRWDETKPRGASECMFIRFRYPHNPALRTSVACGSQRVVG